MEVHVRNVLEQATQNALNNFLKPHLQKLSIRAYSCKKQRGKKYVSLTFLRVHDGERFPAHHGQVKIPLDQPNNLFNNQPRSANRNTSNPQSQGFRVARSSAYAVHLKFLGQQIYCEKSPRDGDQFLLRVLQRGEKERREVTSRAVATSANDHYVRTIRDTSLDIRLLFCFLWCLDLRQV